MKNIYVIQLLHSACFAKIPVAWHQNKKAAQQLRSGEALFGKDGALVKGKHMPGHMGAVRVTVQNLEVVSVDAEKNLILVKGAVPGPKKSLVMLKESVKA